MFPNLNAEIARIGLDAKQFSELCGIKYATLLNKLAGKTEFTRSEMLAIKNSLHIEAPIEDLFAHKEAAVMP